MKKKAYGLLVGCLFAAMAVNALSHGRIKAHRQNLLVTFHPPSLNLPISVLEILAGEFKGLVADWLLLEIGSFSGSNQKATDIDYQKIYQSLNQVLFLDPYFEQAYVYAQGLLPWRAGMARETIELLDRVRQHRHWDFFPGQYMGFDLQFFLNDYARASEVYLESAKIDGAPVFLAVLGGRMAIKGQRTKAAMEVMLQMLAGDNLADYHREQIKARLKAMEGVYLLEQAIAAFKTWEDHFPESLHQLEAGGYIAAQPRNPYNVPYTYDPQTGRVSFD